MQLNWGESRKETVQKKTKTSECFRLLQQAQYFPQKLEVNSFCCHQPEKPKKACRH